MLFKQSAKKGWGVVCRWESVEAEREEKKNAKQAPVADEYRMKGVCWMNSGWIGRRRLNLKRRPACLVACIFSLLRD